MSKLKSISLLAELLMEVTPKTMQSIREEMRAHRGEALSVPQFRVLAAVQRGLTHNKEIGQLLGVSEAAISRMIDGLVQEGLLQKGINKNDRRLSVLGLTVEGRKLFTSIKSSAKLRLKNKLSRLSSEDTKTIIMGLETLARNLDLFK